jgi:rhodanese-related sulfurtransferase
MSESTITPLACHELLQSGVPIDLVDVRTPMEFSTLRADRARLLPLDQLTAAALPAERRVALICQSGGRARQAAQKLRAAGREDVVVVEGGTDAWSAAGLPCIRGTSRSWSLERQVRVAAGSLVTLGVGLGWLIHPAFYGVSLFVGLGLIFAGVTDTCGMGLLLAKLPWNRAGCSTR